MSAEQEKPQQSRRPISMREIHDMVRSARADEGRSSRFGYIDLKSSGGNVAERRRRDAARFAQVVTGAVEDTIKQVLRPNSHIEPPQSKI